jgi:cytochrome c oxidase subunit 3
MTTATGELEHGALAMTVAAREGVEVEGEARLAINRLGLSLFILSESMLFGAFLAARFYLAGLERPAVNVGLGSLMTLVLIASSGLSYRGLAALRRDQRRAAVWSLGATALLGLLFLAGVALEWSTAEFSAGTPYGTAFFSTTGLHAAHVLSAVLVMVAVTRLLARGHFSPRAHWGVAAAVTYWTFVDALWVLAIFPTFYLL